MCPAGRSCGFDGSRRSYSRPSMMCGVIRDRVADLGETRPARATRSPTNLGWCWGSAAARRHRCETDKADPTRRSIQGTSSPIRGPFRVASRLPSCLRTGSLARSEISRVSVRNVSAAPPRAGERARERTKGVADFAHSLYLPLSLPPLTANSNGVKFSAKASGVVRH